MAEQDNRYLAITKFGFRPVFLKELSRQYREWARARDLTASLSMDDYKTWPREFFETQDMIDAARVVA